MSKKTNKIAACKFADFIKDSYVSMFNSKGKSWWEHENNSIELTTEELYDIFLKQSS